MADENGHRSGAVTEPWARVERDPQGVLSLRSLFARRPDRPAAAADRPSGPGPIPGLQVSVRELSFDNGGSSIVDTTVEPAGRFEVRGTSLTVRNLTWPAAGSAAAVSTLSTPMPTGGTLKRPRHAEHRTDALWPWRPSSIRWISVRRGPTFLSRHA